MRHAILGVVLVTAIPGVSPAQTPSAADGPWSGQVQCVLSARGPDYQDDQTHTWRLTAGTPEIVGMFRRWPAVWSVQGSGSRQLSTPPQNSPRKERLGSPAETWKTTVPDTSAPIAVWEPAAGRIRFGSQHGLLNINGAITGTASTGTAISAPFQEWEFPVVEDAATLTTISGTRTRSVPGRAWRQPPSVLTTETCTWNYTRGGSPAAQSSSSTGTTTTVPTVRAAGTVGTIQQVQTPQPVPAPTVAAVPSSASAGPLPATTSPIGGRQASEISPGTGAGVTAKLAWASREIALTGFTAEGVFTAVPARTITVPGFTAAGEFAPIPPRTITTPGWTASGP